MISIISHGLANRLRRLTLVGIDEPEVRAGGIALADLLNDRRIATGDRTISPEKNQHHNFAGIGRQRIYLVPVEINGRLTARNDREECTHREDCNESK